jgi:hypothetical protein
MAKWKWEIMIVVGLALQVGAVVYGASQLVVSVLPDTENKVADKVKINLYTPSNSWYN